MEATAIKTETGYTCPICGANLDDKPEVCPECGYNISYPD